MLHSVFWGSGCFFKFPLNLPNTKHPNHHLLNSQCVVEHAIVGGTGFVIDIGSKAPHHELWSISIRNKRGFRWTLRTVPNCTQKLSILLSQNGKWSHTLPSSLLVLSRYMWRNKTSKAYKALPTLTWFDSLYACFLHHPLEAWRNDKVSPGRLFFSPPNGITGFNMLSLMVPPHSNRAGH